MANPTPGTPVPSDELREQWIENAKSQTVVACYGSPIRIPSPNIAGYCINKAADWGYDQAMQDRAVLRLLLNELLDEVQYAVDNCELALDSETLIDRARAWAERLGGGGSDG